MGSRVVPLGTTGLEVTNLPISANTLANVRDLYGYEVERERALETLRIPVTIDSLTWPVQGSPQ